MRSTADPDNGHALAGLHERARSRIRIGRGGPGIERMEAQFTGAAFSPHRHDTYAIGITLSGIQAFRYRGEQRYCLPGQCHILHPDEVHDGRAGTVDGFGYRMVYLDPSLVQQALGGKPLPFVAEPVVDQRIFEGIPSHALWRLDDPIDDIGRIETAVALADMLSRAARMPGTRMALRLESLTRIRDRIVAQPAAPLSLHELERISGLDRWTLARQFRAAFGTSPSRFRTMRQLDQARRLIRSGHSLATAALDAGFADQSHMSRMFKRTYGLTPATWAASIA